MGMTHAKKVDETLVLITPTGGLHDKEGVVHRRGWGFVPVAMCLISLSRVLDLAQSWCTMSFVNIVGSYGVSSLSLSCCDEFSLALWGFVMLDWILDLRSLDVCLACGYPWWQWGILLSYLMYVLVFNLRIPVVDTRFRPTFSDRNIGVILCRTLRDCYMIQLC